MIDHTIFPTPEAVALHAAKFISDLAAEAVAKRGRFTMALSGGSTPKLLFKALAATPDALPWDRTILFWGDDRAVEPDSEHSNYRLAHETLLSRVPIPEQNVFRVRGEFGATEAARIMDAELAQIFGDGLPRFDLVLLGMGGDGHTASLFPGTDALEAKGRVATVTKPPATPQIDRVTLTFGALNNARIALFLVTGAGKRQVVREIMRDDGGERYPAARVAAEKTLWFLDEAAFKGE